MQEKLLQLDANDFEETIRFLNIVFAVYGPINFPEFLPKLYKPTDEHMRCNWAIKRNNEIRAVIGLFPFNMRLGNAALKAVGIGGVSVHPDDRGRGYMQKLMFHCLNLMKEQGVQVSWLSGQRQRYGYFGYEIGGLKYRFTLQSDNVRHGLGSTQPVRFDPLMEADEKWLNKISNWHEQNLLRVERPEILLYDTLSGWGNDPFIALNSRNEPIGYVVANPTGRCILELAAEHENGLKDIIAAWTMQLNEKVEIETPPVVSPLTTMLSRVCESFCTVETGNWRVFDWPGVLSATMSAKNKMAPLANGAVRIAIGANDSIELVVDNGKTTSRPTLALPDIQCDEKTAVSLFFRNTPIDLMMPAIPADSVLRNWLPLPLSIFKQDEV